ncbi:hypothetical protein SAMD00019534_008360, partial [Acytostelium subglobosum LB1]|uniref:hypothetical protein n=1 Tax=Acytostelium subglobosum LB1 TaxID=1410327 RepID=UPI000644C91A
RVMDEVAGCLDAYNELDKQWTIFRDKGTKVANKMVNTHLRLTYVDVNEWSTSIKDNINLHRQLKDVMFKSVIDQYQQLYSCYCELSTIVDKLTQRKDTLLRVHSNYPNNNNLTRFVIVNYFIDIVDMYRGSLNNKQEILQSVLGCEDRDKLTLALAAWQSDIHINRDNISTIQDMFTTQLSMTFP